MNLKLASALGVAALAIMADGPDEHAKRVSNRDTCADTRLELHSVGGIQQLERAWLSAEIHGNTTFLDCLLAPEYAVIGVKKDKVVSKAELLKRVASVTPRRDRAIPNLQTKVSINGEFATAYSWIEGDGGKVTASYVDFYQFRMGKWRAVGGVDL